MQDSIFTKIINGEIPSSKIYEDEKTLVILDIYPIQSGQVLVVPKQQIGFIWDLPAEEYQALMDTVQKVGQHLRQAFPSCRRVGVIVEGLDVTDHAHVKVFPFNTDEEFHLIPDRSVEPDYKMLEAMAKKLAF